MISQKKSILLIAFVVFIFIWFFPNICSAWAVYHTTECGEKIKIGECWTVMCGCCGENCTPCCPCCTECSCGVSWKEYKADTTGCQPKILVRENKSVCGPATACCTCGPCRVEYGPWKVCEECGSWQKAERACGVTKAGLEKPECKCNKDCIDKPSNPRYYDNPKYPTNTCNPEAGKNPNNIYLPVKLDWDDVRGWKDGWKENGCVPCSESCPTCPALENKTCYEKPECVQSYEIRIEGLLPKSLRSPEALRKIDELEEKIEKETDPQKKEAYEKEIKRIRKEELPMNATTTFLDKSEFIPCSCMFKSNRTYKWQVRACCSKNEATCGPWSEKWTFTTNPTPEPKLPYDPDWNGTSTAENIPFNLTLEWCEIDDPLEWRGADGKEYQYYETTVEEEKYYCPLAYKLFFYETKEKKDLCHPLLKRDGECIPYLLVPEPGAPSLCPPPKFPNEKYAYFTKDIAYAWEVAACKDSSGIECTEYSQRWRFEITGKLEAPSLVYPPNEPSGEIPVGVPIVFRWAGSFGSASFNYEVYDEESGKRIYYGTSTLPNFPLDIPSLQINKKYYWRVQPCWDMESKECEDVWAESYFWTTGRPPKPESMKTESPTDIFIPVNFGWENVPGAKSFRFKIQGVTPDDGIPVEEPKKTFDYPDLKQEKNYSWEVRTCARENGEVCGEWSEIKTFKTFKLTAPRNPSPKDGEEIFTYEMPKNFSWDSVSGARYYKYILNYVSKSPEETKDCLTGKVKEEIYQNNFSGAISLNCLGEYQWQVRACLDRDCNEAGDFNEPPWRFTLSQKEVAGVGLVPCGRTYDNPNTPWNEREPCQIKHLFLIIKIILDFFLWNLIPIILVLLVVATGAIFYLFSWDPNVLVQIKSIWKAIGIGILVIFLAWTIITIFMSLLGYRVGIYGPWWQIQF